MLGEVPVRVYVGAVGERIVGVGIAEGAVGTAIKVGELVTTKAIR